MAESLTLVFYANREWHVYFSIIAYERDISIVHSFAIDVGWEHRGNIITS